MSFINFTPHAIVVMLSSGSGIGIDRVTIEPSGIVLRVDSFPGEVCQNIGGVVIYSPSTTGDIVGLDEAYKMCKESNKLGIVSLAVANALEANGTGLDCFVRPGTGPDDEAIRNEKGHIVCVTRFIQVNA